MTYFGFLWIFLVIPLIVLLALTLRDSVWEIKLPSELGNWSPRAGLTALAAIAVIYTTPWDNYLVATRVWWYDSQLVAGVVLGWVPLEEYIFFITQTLLTGLWILYWARRWTPASRPASSCPALRRVSSLVVVFVWLGSIMILVVGWRPGTYLGLELSWALLPIMLQLAFGADILWRYRRLLFLGIVPTTLYLSAADALALSSGTWTINPDLSIGINLAGILPLEELLFFTLTNTLVSLGLILVVTVRSQQRLEEIIASNRLAQAAFVRDGQR